MLLGKYIQAIVIIFISATLGWVALGSVNIIRTNKSYTELEQKLE